MNVKTLIIPLLLVLFCCAFGCRNKQHSTTDESARDLPQIKDSGELVVLTLYSSTSYFIYRGQEMGFQYELSEQFAKSLGLKLRIEVAKSVDEMIQKLLAGEGDMIAYNLPITKEWKDSLLYCGEDVITHQVIVQQGRGKQKPLKDVTELVGKDIYVKPGKYYDRLVNLNSELGGGIRIHEVTNDSTTIEDLITQVAQGKIPYTVADNDLAKLNKTYYPNLNIDLSISFDQRSSWAVRKDSPELAAAATKWHQENMTSPAYTASMKLSRSCLSGIKLKLRSVAAIYLIAAFTLSSGFCSLPGGTPIARAVAGINCISPLAPAQETAVVSKLDSV